MRMGSTMWVFMKERRSIPRALIVFALEVQPLEVPSGHR